MRTRAAHLGELNDEGKTVRVTYFPTDQVFQFKIIGGEHGRLPRTYTLKDLWGLVRQVEEKLAPQKLDPNQLEHPLLTGQAEVPAQMHHEVLPEAGPENHEGQNLQPVQEPSVGSEEPAEVCVQKPQESGETAGQGVQSDVSGVQPVRNGVGVRASEGEIRAMPLGRSGGFVSRLLGGQHPGNSAGNERPPVPLQDAPVDEGRDAESGAGISGE
jgi:hypothetical protein